MPYKPVTMSIEEYLSAALCKIKRHPGKSDHMPGESEKERRTGPWQRNRKRNRWT
jgi:hypothetical protein